MTNVNVFQYKETQEVRTIWIDNILWFVVADICNILDLGTVTRVIERLDADELNQTQVMDKMGRKQQMYICDESGLYNLILRSEKPEAKSFKKWITKDVLPSIRQTGSYFLEPKSKAEALLEAVQLIVEHDKQLREHKAQLENHENRITEIEAQITTVNKDYLSLAGYYALKKQTWGLSQVEASQIGKQLKKASNLAGMPIIRIHDSKFGEVNGYHKDILAQVLAF